MTEQTLAIGLGLLVLGASLELCLYITASLWKHRVALSIVCLCFLGFASGIFMVTLWWPWALLVVLISVYRMFSLLRLAKNRTHPTNLRRSCSRSFVILASAQLVAIGLALVFNPDITSLVSTDLLALKVACVALVGALVLLLQTVVSLQNTKRTGGSPLSDAELPTVTVAIPARNETAALASCLTAIVASDYPKLEILVLDDCSQDKTTEIIKSFAHSGVRFVLGTPASDDWLAKNHAYHQLQQESSGELLLFMGVDVRLHQSSIRELVCTLVANEQHMISVLPKRTKSGLVAAVVQPMRYWRELAIPAIFRKWPPTLSTCWLIKRSVLEEVGGFGAVKRAILPERHFAKKLGARYRFMRTSGTAIITTHKDFTSQFDTAVRTRYPELHRRPEAVLAQTLALLILQVVPFVLLLMPSVNIAVRSTAFAAICALGVTQILIARATNPAALYVAWCNSAVIAIVDILALHVSMYRYEFGEVLWKGRNVCIPVMQVIRKLPDTKP